MEMANQNGVVRFPSLPAKGLQRFVITNKHICYRNPGNVSERGGEDDEEEEEEEDAIELSLGLSSNGRFGTDPGSRKRKNNELTRSSSIPEGFAAGETRPPAVPIASDAFQVSRTQSLPVDTGEEDRRRKEWQSRRRMEAMRKRSEKTRAFRELQAPRWENGETHVGNGSSEFNGDIVVTMEKKKKEEEEEEERARKILEKMPSVRTKEAGPDGRRVEGFLYWFGNNNGDDDDMEKKKKKKGEEVRIVCVCHGFFLSPADFLRHGGSSAAPLNPLRHIVLTPPSSSL